MKTYELTVKLNIMQAVARAVPSACHKSTWRAFCGFSERESRNLSGTVVLCSLSCHNLKAGSLWLQLHGEKRETRSGPEPHRGEHRESKGTSSAKVRLCHCVLLCVCVWHLAFDHFITNTASHYSCFLAIETVSNANNGVINVMCCCRRLSF